MISAFDPANIKMLVFDIDNTVTRDTSDIKTKVLQKMFSEKLDRLQEARELYESTGKGDRYNIIAHILDKPQAGCRENKLIQYWADMFEQTIQAAIRNQGIHPDDLEILTNLKKDFRGSVYLLSASPQVSVVDNIEYFESIYPKLSGLFTGVIGTPMNNGKGGELRLLAKKHSLSVSNLVMIGDGASDYSGAMNAGTQFIAIIPEGKLDKWPEESFPKLSSIADLPKYLL